MYTFGAVRGRQAGSDFYVAMCNMKYVATTLEFDASISPEHRAQRTLRKSRIPKIRDYILQNPTEYVFSSITVSVDGKITFNPISDDDNLGTISMLQSAKILINDGQHRVRAIREAVKEKPNLANDEISVVFFEDRKLKKCQQMFADLNKHALKPTKSLGILFDHRNDFASFIVKMSKSVKVFQDRIDLEKTSISNRSTKFFTLSGLAAATKQLLGKDRNLRSVEKTLAINFWNEVGKNIPEWTMLIEKKVTPADLRNGYVHANTNMLEAIAIAGHWLIKKFPNDWKKKLRGLQDINWSRTNPEWDDKIIIRGKMTKTKAGMNNAAKILVKHCEGV